MFDRAHVLLKDDRKDLRIKEDEHLAWRIKYRQKEGFARIRNISASGMLMETDVVFDPKEECILSFDSNLGDRNYIPRLGRLVWNKKKRFSRNKYHCGIKFLDADEDVLTRMRTRVEKGVARHLKRKKMTTAAGFLVCIAALILIEYIVYTGNTVYKDISKANEVTSRVAAQQAVLTRNYLRLYRTSEANLADANGRLDIANEIIAQDKAALALFSKELEATGALLSRTEDMLTESNTRNAELSKEVAALQAQVEAQMARKESAAAVANVELSMAEYRQKLQEIKAGMRALKTKEQVARLAAQAEVDQEKMRLGNNGYFMKEGQVVQVDEAQYERLDTDMVSAPAAKEENRAVEINVTFFDTP